MTEMDRAELRRRLRVVGYRGTKSRRNRLTKEQAIQVLAAVDAYTEAD